MTAAFVAPDPPAHEAEAPHGRALVFAELTFEALSAAAAGAPEGTALHAARALVAEAEAAHAASEDPDKGDWVVPLGLRAALFDAKSRDDADAHRAALTEARTAAHAAAREAVASAETSLEEARSAHDAAFAEERERAKAARDAGEPWPPVLADDEPLPPDPVADAEDAKEAAKETLREAKEKEEEARIARHAPAKVTMTYHLGEDLRADPRGETDGASSYGLGNPPPTRTSWRRTSRRWRTRSSRPGSPRSRPRASRSARS